MSDCYLPRLGGIELQVHDLARRQSEAGHDVSILTTTAGPSSIDVVAGPSSVDVVAGPVDVIRVGRGPKESIRYRSAAAGATRLTRTLDQFDLVHAHTSSFSPLTFLCAHHAARRGTPTVATVHSLWAKATPLFSAFDVFTRWGSWPVTWSAVSNAAAASIRGIVGDRAEVTILPNGVDPSEWTARTDLATAPEALRLVAVSRLARRKRILQLVEILQVVRDQLPESVRLEVQILGEGPQRPDIERYLHRHDMGEWVHLQGRRSRAEIADVLAGSHLFVAPATLESFGIAALEARCAGLPIVARAGTGVEDFVVDGREGWLVRSDAAMIDTIVSLARTPDVLAGVAAHNRSTPASISWTGVLGTCEDLYRKASARHGRDWVSVGVPQLATQ